jgi:hypothetical protein
MAQIEAGHLIQQVDQEMLEYGVSRATLPMPAALPKLMLPRNLRYEQIQTRYIAWCNATGRPGPTDMQVEMEGMRWYREHVAPEKPDGD